MDYLHNFTVTVLLVTFLCFFCEALCIDGALGKYTSLVTGLVVALAIVSAFLQIRDVDFTALALPESAYAAPQTDAQADAVAAQFALDLAGRVEARVKEKFGAEITARAEVTCVGEVLTVERLTIENTKLDAATLTRFVEADFGITPTVN